jgi:hypothetical protein
VARNDTSKEKVFENPKKLTDFFMAMDTDGNGIVDGNEFMIAMNSEASTNDGTTIYLLSCRSNSSYKPKLLISSRSRHGEAATSLFRLCKSAS